MVFFLFLLVSFFLLYFFLRERTNSFDNSVSTIKGLVKDGACEIVIGAKCSTHVFGGKNTNYLFNRADLYIMDDTVFICGYSKFFNWKIKKSVIVLSRKKERIKLILPKASFPILRKLNANSNKNEVFIEFTEEDYKYLILEIRFIGLTNETRNNINIYK